MLFSLDVNDYILYYLHRIPLLQLFQPCGAHGAAEEDEDDPDIPEDLQDLLDVGYGNFPNVDIEPDHPLLLEATIRGEEKRERMAARLFRHRVEEED